MEFLPPNRYYYYKDNTPIFVPPDKDINLFYLCLLIQSSKVQVRVTSLWGCLKGGRSPTEKHPQREPP